jgi:hypothetical protein
VLRVDQRRIGLVLFIVGLVLSVLLVAHFKTSPSTAPNLHPAIDKVGPSSVYPDPIRTPGVNIPSITQSNIQDTICNPDWSTKSIRPSSSYTTKLKHEQMQELHISGDSSDYEEDHLIPLELGGDPRDPRNLWPEPYSPQPGAREKDVVENYLHKEVCAGNMTLEDAQHEISTDWYRVYLSIHPRETQEQR